MAKINQEEYEFLKGMNGKFKWVARDESGYLYCYKNEPRKAYNDWLRKWCGTPCMDITEFGFWFVKWGDENPYNIQELIDEYEIKELRLAPSGTVIVDSFDESEEAEVKKDLNWFKEKLEVLKDIDRRMLEQSEPNSKNQSYFNGSMAAIDEALDFLNQLDEPKVLSWEWIDENKKDSGVHYIGYYVPIGRLHDLLVPKQEEVKVKSQDFDLIKTHKVRGENLHDFVRSREINRDNCDHLVDAWLAYPNIEVEREQKYYVLLPEIVDHWRYVSLAPNHWGVTVRYTDTLDDVHEFTEQEIKDYDERYWPFAVKVEEEEE